MAADTASEILTTLAAGFDPRSGHTLGDDAVWRDAAIGDALRAGAAALTAEARMRARRSNPAQSAVPNRGKPWSAEDEEALLAAFAREEPLAEIGTSLGRSVRAIEARLEKLGQLAPEQRTTSDRFPLRSAPVAQSDAAQSDAAQSDAAQRRFVNGHVADAGPETEGSAETGPGARSEH